MDRLCAGSMFHIVNFVGGRKRMVVPDSWLSVNDTLCLLPPIATYSDMEVLVRNSIEPGEKWQILEVKSLETFDSYSEAKKQLEKAREKSFQRKRKKPSYLEDYTNHDSDDGRSRPYTALAMDFDEEAMSENEWIPPPEFSQHIENASSVRKTIRNDHRTRNHRFRQSQLSSEKENIDFTCDCQSSCHGAFLQALHSMQRQLDRTNQMVQQLLGGQKQTHSQLKRILQSRPVNQKNGPEEMDVFSQDSSSFVQSVLQDESTSAVQKGTENEASFSASEDTQNTRDKPSTSETKVSSKALVKRGKRRTVEKMQNNFGEESNGTDTDDSLISRKRHENEMNALRAEPDNKIKYLTLKEKYSEPPSQNIDDLPATVPESKEKPAAEYHLSEEKLKLIVKKVKPGIYGDSLFVKKLAVEIFGESILAISSVTGRKCVRIKDGVAKPQLCPEKLLYIKGLLEQKILAEKADKEELAKRIKKMNAYVAEKIATLLRYKS